MGTRLMTSTPHAAATSTTPAVTKLLAMLVACCDEPHWLSTVVQAAEIGQARGQPRGAGDVERLRADLADAATDDLLDLGRVDTRALDHGLSGRPTADRRGGRWTGHRCASRRAAHGFDDDDITHGRDRS